MGLRLSRKDFLKALPLAALWLTSCNKASDAARNKLIRIGYMGLTCEAPIFMAWELGYFKAEEVEVELVKTEWTQFKDLLGLGKIDMGQQPVMMFLKPIEQGLDVKMTAGVHKGCLRIQAPKDSSIQTVQDLRGKRIGVPGMGTPPFIYANRMLGRNGVDPRTDIEWRVFPGSELGLALQKGAVDAVATTEPVGSLLMAQGYVRNVTDLGVDPVYADEYCCSIMLNGKNSVTKADSFARAVRAILKGAKWVETNPRAAARMSVEKNYLASNPELNAQALSLLRYVPSVSGGRDAIRTAATDMMAIGMLPPTTNVSEVTQRIFAEMDGVTDEWLNSVTVPLVAGGQILPDQMDRVSLELQAEGGPAYLATCCKPQRT